MSSHQRDKERLEEIDRALGDNMAKAGQATDQSTAANPQPSPYEEFKQLITELQATAREQQLKTEQSIQQTLQHAATALGDAQKIDLITGQLQAMQKALTEQGPDNNPQYFTQMLKQLATQVREQQYQSDRQVAQALQQAVASISQSQSAMFDSQAYTKVIEMIKQCEKNLQQWQNPSQEAIH